MIEEGTRLRLAPILAPTHQHRAMFLLYIARLPAPQSALTLSFTRMALSEQKVKLQSRSIKDALVQAAAPKMALQDPSEPSRPLRCT